MSSKTAIIFGITGQDGSLLAKLLLKKKYTVIGQTRSLEKKNLINLKNLDIINSIQLFKINEFNLEKLTEFLEHINPIEIYNLSGQSSVGLSFMRPNETLLSQLNFVNLLLEAMLKAKSSARLFNAGSGECFGDTSEHIATESSVFRPANPYAVAKCGAFWTILNYRKYFNINASTGILFNHESNLRPINFVTRKIILAAVNISNGSQEKLCLGNLEIKRDWGLAEEYVLAMWQILQQNEPDDYIISTGKARSLQDFLEISFGELDLDWHEHVEIDHNLYRASDTPINHGDPSKAKSKFGFSCTSSLEDVVKNLINCELNLNP